MVKVKFISAAILLICSVVAKAAIPPLSQEELDSSPYIFIGNVLSISTQSTADNGCGASVDLMLTINIESTIATPVKLPQTLNVHGSYRQTKCKDSDLMPGPAGVIGLQKLKVGMKVKIYAQSKAKDRAQNTKEKMISIRHPNGLEFIKLSFGQ